MYRHAIIATLLLLSVGCTTSTPDVFEPSVGFLNDIGTAQFLEVFENGPEPAEVTLLWTSDDKSFAPRRLESVSMAQIFGWGRRVPIVGETHRFQVTVGWMRDHAELPPDNLWQAMDDGMNAIPLHFFELDANPELTPEGQ